MNVETLSAPDAACDAFVSGRPDGKICHLPSWSFMVQRVFGHQSWYLVARESLTVRGVLPLVHVRSRLFGNRMVSQAFANYGGILADGEVVQKALFDRAVEIAAGLGCESIELRNIDPLPYDLQLRGGKACMHLPLSDPEALWKGFDPKVRNQVRKAEKSGIVAVDGGAELVDDFYAVYTSRMRQLGTPCYSRRFMKGMVETFPNNGRVFVVRLDEKPIGAGITTCFNGFAEIPLAATLTEYNSLCPNNLLYWSVIRHYAGAGASVFDFGRSTVGAGTYQFKKQWDPTQVDMHYQYWVAPGHELSISSPDNPQYRRKVEMWKRLPLWLTRLLGPRISRGLP
jgi:FemAB-related protein (PEP-CTERM system-associated)